MHAALLEHLGEVVLCLGLDVRVVAHGVLVGEQPLRGRQHRVGPALEGGDLRGVQPELLGDHQARQGEGEVGDEVALASIDEGVDELVGEPVHRRHHALHPLRGQGAVEESAVAAVVRRVGAMQRRDVPPADLREALLVHAPEMAAGLAGVLLVDDPVGEGLRVGGHCLEVFVA